MRALDSKPALPESFPARRGSAFIRTAILAFALPLAGCVSTPELALDPGISQSVGEDAPRLVHAFAGTCLAGEMDPARIVTTAGNSGWREADRNGLAAAGLERLVRSVTEIPGGGGRFRDEQSILVYEDTGDPADSIHLEVLVRDDRDGNRSISCSVFARSNLLAVCEATGRLLERPPDTNTYYEKRDARFLSWEAMLDGMPGSVSCRQAPHSGWLRYDGVELAAEIRLEETRTVARFRSSPPQSDDRGR